MADKKIYLVCGSVAIIILLIDLSIPLGVAAGVPYVLVILLSLSATEQRTTLFLAILCTVLIITGYFASPEGGIMWQVLLNRMLAVFVVWTTAILSIHQLKKERQLKEEQVKSIKMAQDIQIQLEKMSILKATMRTVLDIVGNFLNNMQLVRLKIESKQQLSESEIDELEHSIHDTAEKLRELANVESIKEKEMAGGLPGIDFEDSNTNQR